MSHTNRVIINMMKWDSTGCKHLTSTYRIFFFFFFFYKFGNSTFNIVSKDHQAEVLLVKQVLATHVHASQTDLVNFNNQSLKLFRITT